MSPLDQAAFEEIQKKVDDYHVCHGEDPDFVSVEPKFLLVLLFSKELRARVVVHSEEWPEMEIRVQKGW